MPQFIDGTFVEGSGSRFKSINPATQEIVWEGNAASEEDIKTAIASSQKAFLTYRKTTIGDRKQFCYAFSEIVKKNEKELAETISKEMGKPLWESLTEVESVQMKVRASIQAMEERISTKSKESDNHELVLRHKPHGVVAVFGPFNFPCHLPNGHIIPALLAGNTVIYKPSEFTPKTAEVYCKFWKEAGLPPGVLNMVQGAKEVGIRLVQEKALHGLYFTGSDAVGKEILKNSLEYPQRIVALEMGGNNPLIVTSFEDEKAAVIATLQSAFLTSGQRCSCARRLILVRNKQTEAFLQKLIQAAEKIRIGSYSMHPEPFMGPLVSVQAKEKALKQYEQLKSLGCKPLNELKKEITGAFINPLFIDVTGKVVPDEEIFAPILKVHFVENFDAAIREAGNTQFGLTASLISQDRNEFEKLQDELRVGILNLNLPTTGASSFYPFGGIGKSGNYRPSGYFACDYCSYPMSSTESEKCELPKKPNLGLESVYGN